MTEQKASLALAAAALLLMLAIGHFRPGPERQWGDEPTYVAMTASLAADRDLRFDVRDSARLPDGPAAMILQDSPGGVAYSKPIVYPLLAAPLYAIFGVAGMVATNLLSLAGASLLAWLYLRRLGGTGRATLTLTSFLCAGALLPYVMWRMFEAVEVALILAGLVLTLAAERRGEGGGDRPSPWLDSLAAASIGGLLLGAAASLRYPNAALAAAPVLALLLRGRIARALAVALAVVVAFAGIGLATRSLTGTANPYKAARASFNRQTGFPDGTDPAAFRRFAAAPATNTKGAVPELDLGRSAYATLYFFAGRHSGLAVYLPLFLVFAGLALRAPDRLTLSLFAGALALALFYLVWMPENYFGGATTIGNRYFLPAYPLALVALRWLPKRRHLILGWLIALVAGGSALASVARGEPRDTLSQSHAAAGIFRLLPYETTAPDLDGRRDVGWSDHFVRFVDRFADRTPWGFRLISGRPAAELVIVKPESGGEVRLLVLADAPAVVIEASDWAMREVYPLNAVEGESLRQVVAVTLTPAWRRHRFWFGEGTRYYAHALRLSVRSPDGAPVTAEVRYLGDDSRPVDWSYPRRVVAVGLPAGASAGGRSELPVRVENTGRRPWSSEGVLPIHLGYRLTRVPGDGTWTEGPRVKLRNPIGGGQTLRSSIPVEWPGAPGRYRIQVDLVVEGVAWFAERAGAPLAEAEVEIAPGPR